MVMPQHAVLAVIPFRLDLLDCWLPGERSIPLLASGRPKGDELSAISVAWEDLSMVFSTIKPTRLHFRFDRPPRAAFDRLIECFRPASAGNGTAALFADLLRCFPQQVDQSPNFPGGQNHFKVTRGAEHSSSFFSPLLHLACGRSKNRLGDCGHAILMLELRRERLDVTLSFT